MGVSTCIYGDANLEGGAIVTTEIGLIAGCGGCFSMSRMRSWFYHTHDLLLAAFVAFGAFNE